MPDHTDELTAMAQEDGMYDVDETTPFRCYPDAEPEIKPRVDEDGVAWCDAKCPAFQPEWFRKGGPPGCSVGGHIINTCICPVAVRRMARDLAEAIGQTDLYKERIQQLYASHARKDVELARLRVEVEAWRSGRLDCAHEGRFYVAPNENAGPRFYNTIDDAVDALIAEREGVTP